MTNQTPSNKVPAWVENFRSKYTSGVAHAFILHFNVRDYVIPGVTLKNYLARLLAERQIVLFYDRSAGITFATPQMEKTFKQVLGLDAKPANQPDPTFAALLGGGQPQGDQPLPRNPADALPLIDKLLRLSDENNRLAAVVVDYAESLVPNADVSAMGPDDRTNLITVSKWGADPAIAAAGNPIFLVTNNLSDVNPAIRAASSKFEAVELNLPDRDARMEFITRSYAQKSFTWAVTPECLANQTAGLSLVHIEDIFLRAEQENGLTLELVKDRKDSIISSEFADVIELTDPRFGFEMVGGLDHVKRFFQNSVIRPMRENRFNRVPMGVLMTGPAGTGKSIVAEAVAFEAGVNAVTLNLAKIFGQYVGQSERNLDKALRVIESLTPAIVFMDEIDQSVSRNTGGGDSGVSSRIFKRLLEFMSDTGHRGKVVFLAATNRPDLMDAALRRPGRFDKKIPFLIPNDAERVAIAQVMGRRYGLALSLDVNDPAVKNTDGWTGAELEAAVIKANELVEDEDLTPAGAFEAATRRLSPSTADIEFMTALAISECNDADLLPDSYKNQLKDRKALEDKVNALRPADEKRTRREL